MPTGNRIRANNIYGTISDNPLTLGSSTFNSSSLPLLPTVASAHAIVVLDSRRVYGNPEIIVVIGHTTSSTVATALRGQYGTTARAHPQGTTWAHVPIDEDHIEIVTSVTRPSDPYTGQMIYETDTVSYKYWNGSAWTALVTSLSYGTPVSIGNSNSAGVAATVARSDHLHDRATGTLPGCRVYTSAQPSVANNTLYTVSFASEAWDTDTIWTVGTPTRLTCKTAGKYNLFFMVDLQLNGSPTYFTAGLYRNGGSAEPIIGSSNKGARYLTGSCIDYLTVNDYLELKVYQTSGASATLFYGAGNTPYAGIQFVSF